MLVAPDDTYTDITEGLFLLKLPYENQLLASARSSSSLTQPSLDAIPPAFPLCIESTTTWAHCLHSGERRRALSDTTLYDCEDR
jgi:hypothetical protein